MKKKAACFNVIKEMFEAADAIRNFNPGVVKDFTCEAKGYNMLFFTGEGSSRMFPAAHAVWLSMRHGGPAPGLFSWLGQRPLLMTLKTVRYLRRQIQA